MSESSLVTTACAQDHFATDLKWKVADPEAPDESSEESQDPHHDDADLVVPKKPRKLKKRDVGSLGSVADDDGLALSGGASGSGGGGVGGVAGDGAGLLVCELPARPAGARRARTSDEEAAAVAIRAIRRAIGPNPHWQVPGGFIVYDMVNDSLDAHCTAAAHRTEGGSQCRCNRKASGIRQEERTRKLSMNQQAQGRPLGFLLAWLQRGLDRECTRNGLHAVDKTFIPHAERLAARRYAVTLNIGALRFERRWFHEGEGEEPIACPG
jgi:hypothetical protein